MKYIEFIHNNKVMIRKPANVTKNEIEITLKIMRKHLDGEVFIRFVEY